MDSTPIEGIGVITAFSEHEPQEITLRGEPAEVAVTRADYDRRVQPRESLLDFMRRSPLHGADDVEFEHDRSLARYVEL